MLSTLEEAPLPKPDVLLCVRSGKIKALGNGGLQSAIDKTSHEEAVKVIEWGITGDEREYVHHQTPDNALHQYCAAHYPIWRRDKPDKKHLFKIGAFGENIALETLSEENVCIGDVYSIGDKLIAQVTQPRLPCFKLNAKFEWPQAAKRTQKTDRYGWYLRVIEPGEMRVRDRMILIRRPNPRWTIKNVMAVLYGKDVTESLVSELRDLEGLGKTTYDLAERRLKGGAENSMARTKGSAFDFNSYEIEDARMITPRIRQLTLAYKGPKERLITETFLVEHAYVRLRFGPPDKPFERSYSIVSGDLDRFNLGVALDDHSRGGSKYLHNELEVGDRVQVARGVSGEGEQPPKGFDKDKVRRHIFLIGGIGVTAFTRSITERTEKGLPVEVHYACRSKNDAAYREKLPDKLTQYYAKDENKRLNINEVIPGPDKNGDFDSFIYACGPSSMMDAVEARCEELKYPAYRMHMESFGTSSSGPLGEPFEVEAEDLDTEQKRHVKVSEQQTLLEALEDAGFEVAYSCRAGKCGICVVNVKCGEIQHKGTGLMEEAKGSSMLSCVSRAKGKIEIEIE